MSGLRAVLMAGGTGGHVFPALATGKALTARGVEVSWLGTRNGLEARLVPPAGYPLDYISIAGLRGNGPLGWAVAPFRVSRATVQAVGLLRQRRPHVVIGMGGFVTGPGGVAARLLGIPLIIHEQNAVAGLTNRLLSRIADQVLQAFPDTFPEGRAVTVGNPVRPEIAAVADPARRYAGREGALRLLVVGGSLGAQALNETVPAALATLPEPLRPQVIHQAGERNIEHARRAYTQAGVEADVRPFLENMAEAYEWADLVLCRAGALTVSELAAAGLPSILVPFPFAVDDHQTRNGEHLAQAGAAWLVPQVQLNGQSLAERLRPLCTDPVEGRRELCRMGGAARAVAVAGAAERVRDICIAAAQQKISASLRGEKHR